MNFPQAESLRNLFKRIAVLLREFRDNGGGVAISQARDLSERKFRR